MAWALEMRFVRGGFNEADATEGVLHARAALAHGRDDANALAVAALAILHLGRDFHAASSAIARALALSDSCAMALFFGAHIHAFSGEAPIAEDYAARALRLSPFDPLAFVADQAIALVQIREGMFDDAVVSFAKGVQANPRFSWLHAEHSAALALAGRIDEAKTAARRLLELEPNFRVRPMMEFLVFMRPELSSAISTGLCQAGLPE